MVKCSVCGETAENLGRLRQHYSTAGHEIKSSQRKRRGEAPPPAVEETDPETTLLIKAVELFSSSGTDEDADERVIRYLITRYAPSIGAAVESDEEAA